MGSEEGLGALQSSSVSSPPSRPCTWSRRLTAAYRIHRVGRAVGRGPLDFGIRLPKT